MRTRNLLVGLTLLIAAFAVLPAQAGDNVRGDQRLSVWTPDQWVVEAGKPVFVAHNPPQTLYAVAARLPGAAADATARARAFVDEQLDEAEFKGDTLTGTAEDDGEDVEFVARTLVDGPDLLIVLTYGEPPVAAQAGPRAALERIRASLKAQ